MAQRTHQKNCRSTDAAATYLPTVYRPLPNTSIALDHRHSNCTAEFGEDVPAVAARTGLTEKTVYTLLSANGGPLRSSTLNRFCAAYRKAAGDVIAYVPDLPGTRGAGIPPLVPVVRERRPRGRPRKGVKNARP